MSALINPLLVEILAEMENRLPSGTGDLSAVSLREILIPIIQKAWAAGDVGDAKNIKVDINGITETFGGVNPSKPYGSATVNGRFTGSLALLLDTMFIMFRAPEIIFFTLRGSSSVIVPVGKPYPASSGGAATLFQWSTRNSSRVTPAGLTLRDITGNLTLGTVLPTTGSLSPALPAFTSIYGLSRTYRIQGQSLSDGNPTFFQDLTITGTVYRAAFISGEDLLNPAAYAALDASTYILAQPNTELVFNATIPVRVYQPRQQRVFFMLDARLLIAGALGATFQVNGQPNNDFIFRDMVFTNEFGATNSVRLFATGNKLNADFPIGANV